MKLIIEIIQFILAVIAGWISCVYVYRDCINRDYSKLYSIILSSIGFIVAYIIILIILLLLKMYSLIKSSNQSLKGSGQ
jgi:hypothetical protein